MGQQDRGFSPNPFNEQFSLGQTLEVNRQDLSDPALALSLTDVPAEYTSALRSFAQSPSVKGMAILREGDEPYLQILHEPMDIIEAKRRVELARLSLITMSLGFVGILAVTRDMNQLPIQEMEAEIKRELVQKPQSALLALVRITG